MNRLGPIVLIEDDPDDVGIIRTAIQLLNISNPLREFTSSAGVLGYLTNPDVDPLMVISDINLPRQHGIDLYKQLITEPAFAEKQVPYVFLSTSPEYVTLAADVSKCGYFVKPRDYFAYVNIVQRIVLYWLDAESR